MKETKRFVDAVLPVSRKKRWVGNQRLCCVSTPPIRVIGVTIFFTLNNSAMNSKKDRFVTFSKL